MSVNDKLNDAPIKRVISHAKDYYNPLTKMIDCNWEIRWKQPEKVNDLMLNR